jgi:hypothetical protein
LNLLRDLVNTRKAGVSENVIIGRGLTEAVQSKTWPQRFMPVSMDERKQIEMRGRDVHRLRSERAKIETGPKSAGKSKWVLQSKGQPHRGDVQKRQGKQEHGHKKDGNKKNGKE